jgi:hypothetical protein
MGTRSKSAPEISIRYFLGVQWAEELNTLTFPTRCAPFAGLFREF